MCEQKLSESVLRTRQHSREFKQTVCLSNYVESWGVKYVTSSNIFVSFRTETDDYAEIIDEEDTYTMPSSK